MPGFILALVAIVGVAVAAGPTEMRTWSDINGTQFYGRAVALNGNEVVFEGGDGSRVTVLLHELSQQDRILIEEHFLGASIEKERPGWREVAEKYAEKLAENKPVVKLAMGLVMVGTILSLIGGVWFLVVAFRESVLWGLGCLFFWFVSLFFLISHWDRAKRPFAVLLLGAAALAAGIQMVLRVLL